MKKELQMRLAFAGFFQDALKVNIFSYLIMYDYFNLCCEGISKEEADRQY